MAVDGRDVRGLPLVERKALLVNLMPKIDCSDRRLQFPEKNAQARSDVASRAWWSGAPVKQRALRCPVVLPSRRPATMRKPPSPIVALADVYPDERELYAWTLEAAGFRVARIGCGSAAEAAAEILGIGAAVVITRIRPGIFGIELTGFLREAGLGAPIVVITTDTKRELHDAARAAGANDVYLLPLEPDALTAAVRRHVDSATTGRTGGVAPHG